MIGVFGCIVIALLSGCYSQELGVVHMRLEGRMEKCLVEELPANTVALGISDDVSFPFEIAL